MAKAPVKRSKPRAPTQRKTTPAAFAKRIQKHFPTIKQAAEAALREAGLHDATIHSMSFAPAAAMADGCSPACNPATEKCRYNPTLGRWFCESNG
jgi:hypothetical protein